MITRQINAQIHVLKKVGELNAGINYDVKYVYLQV
mgnify:CR=1 FL=1